jgi:GT2 family glycosyltransferase
MKEENIAKDPIDIVILTYNRLKYLQQTVDALFERTTYPFRLTIVDNNSEPDVRGYLEKNRELFHHLILNDKNEYVPAFHLGIKTTTSEIFIATEPDIIVTELSPCWLTQYMEIFQDNPKLGLLGIRLDPSDRTSVTPAWSGGTDAAPVYNKRVLLGNVGVWMMAIRRVAYSGNFPSECSVCEGVRKKGYVAGYTRDIYARHIGWYEYRDYPEYLLKKSKRPHPCFPFYAEAQLVDRNKVEPKKLTIVTTTFNGRLDWLKALLKSIETFTPRPFNMIVVDNGTTDETTKFLRSLNWITTIRNEKNLDDTLGVNQALECADTDYIVKIDTDALIADHGWWEAIHKFMEENQKVGIAGDVWNPGFEVSSRLYKSGWSPKKHGIKNLNHVQGGFMVLRKKMLDQIGLFNEDFPHDGMDVEMSYRALSYGWQLGPVEFVKAQIFYEPTFSSKLKVYHPVRNSSLRQQIMKKVNQVNHNKQYFKEEILLGQNGQCLKRLNSHGKCLVSSEYIWISGRGWDNCLISKRSFNDLVFSVGISDMQGSAILKVRLQDKNDPASNSYHVILGDWGNYVAKSCHVFKRFRLPSKTPIQLVLESRGHKVKVILSGKVVAQFHDKEIREGHVYLGVKDGSAKFINPKIQIY